MASLQLSWRPIPLSAHRDALFRSSQSLAVIGDTAYVFGGERKPRTPVDDVLYSIDLKTGQTNAHNSGPTARVGSGLAALDGSLYLWGGRGGKEMSPLSGTLGKFDVNTSSWSEEAHAKTASCPEIRSFHTLVATEDRLFVHAGCPAKGRLPSLSSYAPSLGWKALSDAPDKARGGTALAVLPGPSSTLARWGGFAGYELAGPLHLYDISCDAWSEAKMKSGSAEPSARSVHGFVGLKTPLKLAGRDEELVAVLLYGEKDPAPPELGHDGAGQFHDDVWGLLRSSGTREYEWIELQKFGSGQGPSPRGWLPVTAWHKSDGTTAIVLQGGLNDKNERLGDLWILEISV